MADWFMPAERPSYPTPPLFHPTQRLRLTNLIDVWQPPILRMWMGLKMTDKLQESRKLMSSSQEERGGAEWREGAGGWQLTEVTDGDTQTRHTTFCQGHRGSLCRRHLRLKTSWIQWELSLLEKAEPLPILQALSLIPVIVGAWGKKFPLKTIVLAQKDSHESWPVGMHRAVPNKDSSKVTCSHYTASPLHYKVIQATGRAHGLDTAEAFLSRLFWASLLCHYTASPLCI